MLQLEIETIILLIIVGHVLSGILGIAYVLQYKKDISLYHFLYARLFDTLAWSLLGLRSVVDHIVLIIIGNAFLIIGQVLQIIAFLKVKDRYNKSIGRIYLVAGVASIAAFCLVMLVYNAAYIRVAVISVNMAILWSFPLYILLWDKRSSVLQRVVGVIFGLEIGILFLRAYAAVQLGELMYLTSSNVYNTTFYMGLYVVMLMGNFGFMLIAKEKSDRELSYIAAYDELTHLYNRRTFLARAEDQLALSSARGEKVSFALIDIDHFKKINDAYGHYAGDQVLKDFASRIRGQLRDCDLLGRFGGEEFAMFFPNMNTAEASKAAERLRGTVADAVVVSDGNDGICYTISIGIITLTPDKHARIETLYKLCDEALYKAKERGRNRVEVALCNQT